MKNLDKSLYKIEIYAIKIIPIVLALICFLNTLLCYLGIDLLILTYIGGISFITLGFLYLSSFVFRFCNYHRMFLHYITIVNIISYIDMEYEISLSNFWLHILYTSLFLLFTFIFLYLKLNEQTD